MGQCDVSVDNSGVQWQLNKGLLGDPSVPLKCCCGP